MHADFILYMVGKHFTQTPRGKIYQSQYLIRWEVVVEWHTYERERERGQNAGWWDRRGERLKKKKAPPWGVFGGIPKSQLNILLLLPLHCFRWPIFTPYLPSPSRAYDSLRSLLALSYMPTLIYSLPFCPCAPPFPSENNIIGITRYSSFLF